MTNKNFDIYFDYGSSKIRTAAINKNNLKNKYFHESDYFYDEDNAESEIEKIILNIEKSTNEYLENINVMMDSPKMLSISLSLSKSFDGSKLKKNDVKFLVQDAKQQILGNHKHLSIMHIIIKKYMINNIEYSFLPENVNCNLLSIDIIFICLPKEIIENLKKIFLKFDISIDQILCASYIKSLNYKENFYFYENLCFVDIGFNKTSIIFYNKNEIAFFHVLPIGSNHITKDLSKVLDLDLITSEKIKLYFNNDVNILQYKQISIDLAQQIIFSRVEEILKLSVESIKLNVASNQSSQFKMVLIGKGSSILDSKFIKKNSFTCEIEIFDETLDSICESFQRLNDALNKQEVVMIPKKLIKKGFFEKLFHFFK